MEELVWKPDPSLDPRSGLVLLTGETAAEVAKQRQVANEREAAEDERRRRHGGQVRTDIKHGVCRSCGKRTQLWLPASICTKCLRKAAAEHGIDIDKKPAEAPAEADQEDA